MSEPQESCRSQKANPGVAHGCTADHHKNWHYRGYLPHFDAAHAQQGITYRLADSLPQKVLRQFRCRVAAEPDERRSASLRRLIEAYLDAGHGACPLRQPMVAEIVLDVWRQTDGVTCDIQAAVVMPNHVHLLIRQYPGHPLHLLVTRWKSQSARLINRTLGRAGPLWMADYWDRFIRDEQHWRRTDAYIRQNPVKAGLVARYEDWPWRL